MPSMPQTEPFGFHVMSPLTLPHGVVYCVAIWPFSISLLSAASSATKRPSPCETGIANTSPALTPESHGDFVFVTRV